MKKFLCVLLALFLLMSLSVTVFAADSNVTYEGNAKRFIFSPGSDYSPSDLFPNFKDVMPGDSITQKLTFRNPVSNNIKIKVYMRSLGAHEDSAEFLSQLKLRVEKLGSTIMFDAAADQSAQLTDWVCLGTLYSGGEVDLNIILDVPVTLDNQFQKQIGYLDWQFKIEELSVEDDDPRPPQTGDNSNAILYAVLMAVSGGIIAVLIIIWRRNKKNET